MKTILHLSLVALAVAFLATADAADVTLTDSIVSLATNGTKYYTFVDPASGHFVELALTLSPVSSDPADVLTSLDGNTRVGVGNPAIGGDGNHIEVGEGVNFTAALVTVSGGVAANSIGFRIAGLGLRDTGGGHPYWFSTSTASNALTLSTESAYGLDGASASLFAGTYLGRLRSVPGSGTYQISDAGVLAGQGLVLNVTFTATANGDPRTNSWFTTYSGKYARIYTNNVAKTNGISGTTWGNGTQNQLTPAYSGIQEVYSSSNYVYFRTTGLGQHTMGPWYNDATITTLFINMPKNSKTLYRIPRNPTVPVTKTVIGGGTIAYTVDGLSVFDARDALAWNGSTETMAGSTGGYWWRDAWPNEGVTFDPGLAHQPQDGTYHYHANPLATRYLLGDHVDLNPTTKMYSESTGPVAKHSPIIGWVPDGFPLYGPYGYSSASNAASGPRRMVSGYVLRNGQNGTDNLTNAAAATLPAWALRAYNVASGVTRPTVASGKPVSRYTEDYAYLGDLTNSITGTNYLKNTDFDLDEWNGRWCVTPEFPNGTYAYFTTINADGSVAYPYIIGRNYYGTLNGGMVTSLTETVATNFVGGPNLRETMNTPTKSGSTVTLTWSAVEGGTYRVESSMNLTTWTTNATGIAAVLNTGSNTNTSTESAKFFRVNRTAIANYDPVSGTTTGGGGSQGISSIVPNSGTHNTSVATTITLNSGYSMAPPPNNVQPTAMTLTLGATTINATSYNRNTTTGVITATFPLGGTLGAYTVNATFGPNTWSLTGGFTIN